MSLRTPFCTNRRAQNLDVALGQAQVEATAAQARATTLSAAARRDPALSAQASIARQAGSAAAARCRDLREELLQVCLLIEAGLDLGLTLHPAIPERIESRGRRLSSPTRSNLWVQTDTNAPLVRAVVEHGNEVASVQSKSYQLVTPGGSIIAARGERRDAWVEWLALG